MPPPEEEELNIPLPQSSVANRQKHYKIIFIKAPSAPSISQQLAQAQIAQQQSEEKTLVNNEKKIGKIIFDIVYNVFVLVFFVCL